MTHDLAEALFTTPEMAALFRRDARPPDARLRGGAGSR